ncbi:MAG: hypothetical protein WBQ23_13245 [Bacteroidota bacterium]
MQHGHSAALCPLQYYLASVFLTDVDDSNFSPCLPASEFNGNGIEAFARFVSGSPLPSRGPPSGV